MSILEQGIAFARKVGLEKSVHESAGGAWQKERGHWNFLTWAFFISQVLGAEQFIGKAAAATATDGDLQSSDNSGTDDAASRSSPGQLADLSQIDADGKISPAVAQGQAADANGTFEGMDGLSNYADPNVLAAFARAQQDAASAGVGGAGTQVASQDPGAASTPLGDSPQLPGDGGQGPLPGFDPGPILDPLLPGIGDGLGDIIDGLVDDAVLPITDTVADLVQSLTGTIDGVLTPLTGAIDDLVGSIDGLVAGVVAPLTGAVDSVVDGAIDPLLDNVGDLVGSLGNSLEQVTEPLTGTIENLTGALGDGLEQVTSPLTGTVGNLVDGLGSAVGGVVPGLLGGPPTQLLGGGSSESPPLLGGLVDGLMGQDEGAGDNALGDAVGSAGQIVFKPLTGDLGLDSLFSGGRYTDYNLALRTSAPDSASSGDSAESGGSATLLEQLLTGDDGHHQSDADPDGLGAPLSLPSVLDDIALRGLGDGISY